MGNIIFKERNLKKDFFKKNVCFTVQLQNPEDNPAFNDFFRELGSVIYLQTNLYDATFCKYDELTNSRTYITIYLDDNGQTFYNEVPVNLVPVTLLTLKSGAEAGEPKVVVEEQDKASSKAVAEAVAEDSKASLKAVAEDSKAVAEEEHQQQTAEEKPTTDVLGGKKTKKLRRFLKTRRWKTKK